MNETMVVIWSYEHNGWWKPDSWGYTNDLRRAGRYTLDEAKKILEGANYGGHINEDIILIEGLKGLE